MEFEKEIWKDIRGYEDLYQVSNYGRVKSLERVLSNGRLWKEHILSQETNHGYKRVCLSKNKKLKHFRVHILVAEAFIFDKTTFKSMPDENRDEIDLNTLLINHKDENKLNNRVDNLEWCTSKYNSNYGRCKYIIGKKLSKTVAQYDKEFNLINKYPSLSEMGRQTGYGIGYVSQCCNGHYEMAYGYKWRYINE